MPFTLAHPAAVLPLWRAPFVPAALVAGAVAPDVPYFVRASGLPVSAQSWYEPLTNATTTHDPVGALVVGLPIALALWAAWLAARPPLHWALGDALPARPARPAASVLGWAVVSAAIGLATHLAWDALTDLARVLQHVSTVLGLVVVAAFAVARRPRSLPRRRRTLAAAAPIVAAGLLGALASAIATLRTDDGTGLEGVLTAAVKDGGALALAAAALLVAAWWATRLSTRSRGAAASATRTDA